ncbi:hypothetical protein ABDK96_13150 [Citricoccus nitrophenolicus]|uniref:Uncharacterized protein n=1 Tax=Citricoccus nitrophenolicus TaxID=863575 RepID=A0ABV0IKD6_9MICC|nr:hypothetical protein [Citricoccus sp. I39-566]WMY78329.1 hypothetical protein RE421_00240 [Citricoccus sp. I39-566]
MTFPPDGSPGDPRDGAAAEPSPQAPASLDHRTLVVRRAPKVQVFLVGGAVLGMVAALIATSVGGENEDFTFGALFGYFLVLFGIVGVALGALVWLVLDRRSRKHTYTVTAEAVEDYEDADYAVQDHDLQQWTDKWENGNRDHNAR